MPQGIATDQVIVFGARLHEQPRLSACSLLSPGLLDGDCDWHKLAFATSKYTSLFRATTGRGGSHELAIFVHRDEVATLRFTSTSTIAECDRGVGATTSIPVRVWSHRGWGACNSASTGTNADEWPSIGNRSLIPPALSALATVFNGAFGASNCE